MVENTLFRFPIPVRFRDLDAYGHVNNATFFTLLEEARIQLLRERFGDTMHGTGPIFLIRSASCEFLKPIPFVDRVVVELWVERMRRTAVDMAYRILDADVDDPLVYATARTTLVCYDTEQERLAALPDWFRRTVTSGS